MISSFQDEQIIRGIRLYGNSGYASAGPHSIRDQAHESVEFNLDGIG